MLNFLNACGHHELQEKKTQALSRFVWRAFQRSRKWLDKTCGPCTLELWAKYLKSCLSTAQTTQYPIFSQLCYTSFRQNWFSTHFFTNKDHCGQKKQRSLIPCDSSLPFRLLLPGQVRGCHSGACDPDGNLGARAQSPPGPNHHPSLHHQFFQKLASEAMPQFRVYMGKDYFGNILQWYNFLIMRKHGPLNTLQKSPELVRKVSNI